MKVLKCCVFLYIHLKSSGHELDNKGQITFSNMDTSRVLTCWLWDWVLQYVTCVVMDPSNISRALSSVVCHCLPDFFFLSYTPTNKNPSVWNFLSPELEVTWRTVAIIIGVALLAPSNFRGAGLASYLPASSKGWVDQTVLTLLSVGAVQTVKCVLAVAFGKKLCWFESH